MLITHYLMVLIIIFLFGTLLITLIKLQGRLELNFSPKTFLATFMENNTRLSAQLRHISTVTEE